MKRVTIILLLAILASAGAFAAPTPTAHAARVARDAGETCTTVVVQVDEFLNTVTIQLPPGEHTVSIATPVWVVAEYEADHAWGEPPLSLNGVTPKPPYVYFNPRTRQYEYFGWSDFPPQNTPDKMWSANGATLSTWMLDDVPTSELPLNYTITVC